MSSAHKAGSESGIDRGVVIIFLVWIAVIIALVVTLAMRADSQAPRSHAVDDRGTALEQHCGLMG
jgi:hypothetical protein